MSDDDELSIRATAAIVDGALRARITVERAPGGRTPLWIDFVATQLCGFCCQPSNRPLCLRSDDDTDSDTGLVDEAGTADARAHCVLASVPCVMAAMLSLPKHATRPARRQFALHGDLPVGLPPSFDGTTLCCEYLLLVTIRVVARPSGWGSGWLSWAIGAADDGDDDEPRAASAGSREWKRGPIRRLRVPLHIDCGREWLAACARDDAVAPGTPLRCELSSTPEGEEPEVDWAMEEEDDHEDEEDGEEEEEEEDFEASRDGASFELHLEGSAFASVNLASSVARVGGAVRGVLRMATRATRATSMVRVRVALDLEESRVTDRGAGGSDEARPEGESTPTPSPRSVAKVDLGTSPPMQSVSFELPLPSHLPADSELRAAHGVAVSLRWALRFTFDVGDGMGVTTEVPWRLPIRVLPSARRLSHAPTAAPAGLRLRPSRLGIPLLGAPIGKLAAPGFFPSGACDVEASVPLP
jgi:hypothetical protein